MAAVVANCSGGVEARCRYRHAGPVGQPEDHCGRRSNLVSAGSAARYSRPTSPGMCTAQSHAESVAAHPNVGPLASASGAARRSCPPVTQRSPARTTAARPNRTPGAHRESSGSNARAATLGTRAEANAPADAQPGVRPGHREARTWPNSAEPAAESSPSCQQPGPPPTAPRNAGGYPSRQSGHAAPQRRTAEPA